jgi:hypothetical protein
METIQMDITGRGEQSDVPGKQNQDSNPPPPPSGPPPSSPGEGPSNPQPGNRPEDASASIPRPVYFQYLGQTDMTVVGPVTGTLYRFGRHGAIVAVDFRDAETLARMSHLRLINVRRGRWQN